MRLLFTKQLLAACAKASVLVGAATAIAHVQLTYTPYEVEQLQIFSPVLLVLVSSSLILVSGGVYWLYLEFQPQQAAIGGHEHVVFDANLQWEARTSSLAWRSWFVKRDDDRNHVPHDHGKLPPFSTARSSVSLVYRTLGFVVVAPWRWLHRLPRLKDEAVSVLKMYCFWFLVWGAKLALAWRAFALLVLVWIATAIFSVPAHNRLLTEFDSNAHRRLVLTNWIRTVGWSARAILVTCIFHYHYTR